MADKTQKIEYLSTMPMGWKHYWIVFVGSLGQLIGTGLATLVGIIIPMLQLILHPELSSWMQGLIGAMDLIGIAVGSVILGRLSDRYGYLFFFRFCPALVLVASIVALIFPHVPVLLVCLFFMGFGIGGEYSLDSDYISELMPDRWKFLMVGVAKGGCAFGNILVAAICWVMILHMGAAQMWPRLLWIMVGITVVMIACRIRFWQSPKWLLDHGENAKAQEAVKHFFGPNVEVVESDKPATPPVQKPIGKFIAENVKQIVLTGIPWACEGLGVYGIGVFLPILVMALGIEHIPAHATGIEHVAASVEVTLWISCIILPGFLLGLWLINRAKLTAIQSWGFLLCAVALVILLYAYELKWATWISIAAFMAFELFLNMGPHLITYVLPSKVYPVSDRGQGTGIAASIGKIGAVLGVFFIPIILNHAGIRAVLWVSAGVMLLGALVTFAFRRAADK